MKKVLAILTFCALVSCIAATGFSATSMQGSSLHTSITSDTAPMSSPEFMGKGKGKGHGPGDGTGTGTGPADGTGHGPGTGECTAL